MPGAKRELLAILNVIQRAMNYRTARVVSASSNVGHGAKLNKNQADSEPAKRCVHDGETIPIRFILSNNERENTEARLFPIYDQCHGWLQSIGAKVPRLLSGILPVSSETGIQPVGSKTQPAKKQHTGGTPVPQLDASPQNPEASTRTQFYYLLMGFVDGVNLRFRLVQQTNAPSSP